MSGPADDKFLFIICMNNSGSTLLERLLTKCRNAIGFLPRGEGPNEQVNGQRFVKDLMPTPDRLRPPCRRVWSEQADVLADESRYDWPKIKEIWREQWSRNLKVETVDPRVFLEKSPPNVYRARMLEKHFPNSSFILMQRNPYAVAEGIRRRANVSIDRCIAHWIRCAEQQMINEKVLGRAITIRYEDLSERPEHCREQIVGLVPEFADLDTAQEISAHTIEGRLRQPIVNYNARQIALLSDEDFVAINSQLKRTPQLMAHFRYAYVGATEQKAIIDKQA
jgi:hypothetical protein